MISEVANVLLYPRLEQSHYEQTQTKTGSSTVTTFMVYKHLASAKSCKMSANPHPEFIILTTSTSADDFRYSELYFGLQSLYFQLHKSENRIIFVDMCRLDYTLSLREGSEIALLNQLSTEGGPDGCNWRTENLELRLNNHKGEQNFLFF